MAADGFKGTAASKGEKVMADALADITSFQLCGFTYEDPNEVCPKILREDGLADFDLLVVIVESWGS